MSPLYLSNGKLLVNDGKLATSEDCCCKDIEVAIFICSNKNVIDNWFDVKLNEKLIGQYKPTQIGQSMLFVTDMDITQDTMCEIMADPPIDPEPCGCSTNAILFNKIQIQKDDFVPNDVPEDPSELGDFNNLVTLTLTKINNTNRMINQIQVWVLVLQKNPFKIVLGLMRGSWEIGTNNKVGDVSPNFKQLPFSNPWEAAKFYGYL